MEVFAGAGAPAAPAPDENEVRRVLDYGDNPDCDRFGKEVVENLPAHDPVPFGGPEVEVSVATERVQKGGVHDDRR